MVGKIKDKTAGVPLEEFVGLKPRIYFFLVDDSTKHKKAKEVKKKCYWNNKTWWIERDFVE